jgi:hypothetical protein
MISSQPKPRRAAALAGAHPHGHAQLLVEVGDPHLQPLPHGGRKGPEGHAADQKGIYLPHGRDPSVLSREEQGLFGGQDPSQQGAQFEFVTARVECRVGEHGDAHELDLVQQASRVVSPSAAPAGHSARVDVESLLVGFIIVHRDDGLVGADESAHGAADTGVGGVRALIDPVIDAEDSARRILDSQGHVDGALAVHAQLDGLHGADRRAAAAEGALLLAPEDAPVQVLGAQRGRVKGSH